MSHCDAAALARIQVQVVDVRNHDGDLVGRLPMPKAEELIAAGLVSPIGRGGIKYLLLNRAEPTVERAWRGGSRTTYRDRIPTKTGISAITQHKSARV